MLQTVALRQLRATRKTHRATPVAAATRPATPATTDTQHRLKTTAALRTTTLRYQLQSTTDHNTADQLQLLLLLKTSMLRRATSQLRKATMHHKATLRKATLQHPTAMHHKPATLRAMHKATTPLNKMRSLHTSHKRLNLNRNNHYRLLRNIKALPKDMYPLLRLLKVISRNQCLTIQEQWLRTTRQPAPTPVLKRATHLKAMANSLKPLKVRTRFATTTKPVLKSPLTTSVVAANRQSPATDQLPAQDHLETADTAQLLRKAPAVVAQPKA